MSSTGQIVIELNAPDINEIFRPRFDDAVEVVNKVETSTDLGITWLDVTSIADRLIDFSNPNSFVAAYLLPPSIYTGSFPPLEHGLPHHPTHRGSRAFDLPPPRLRPRDARSAGAAAQVACRGI